MNGSVAECAVGRRVQTAMTNLHIGFSVETSNKFSRIFEVGHLLQIVREHCVLSLLAGTCDKPLVVSIFFEALVESSVCFQYFIHLPSPRSDDEIGYPCRATIALKLLLTPAEIHPADHGTSRVTHYQIDRITSVVMEVMNDSGKI